MNIQSDESQMIRRKAREGGSFSARVSFEEGDNQICVKYVFICFPDRFLRRTLQLNKRPLNFAPPQK